jgi:outer membrane protein assembly factor BamA
LFISLNITKLVRPGILAFIVLSAFACSPSKYLPDGEYLLSKNKVQAGENRISKEQLKSYIIQTPNKRILGTRFHLFLYNLSNLKKEKWPHNWLRKIGEEPVVYNPVLSVNSKEQLRQFLENKGYYHAQVKDTVTFRKRNAIVSYDVVFNKPYRVNRIGYHFEDTGIVSYILPDTLNSLLQKGMRFDKDLLQQERVRIESLLKEEGFYSFSKEYIYYNATVNPEEYSVELKVHIDEYEQGKPDPYSKVKYHPKYKISNVVVYPNFAETGEPGLMSSTYDTVRFKNLLFLTSGPLNLKPNAIANRNYLMPGDYYKLSNVNRTYRNLSSLNIVRFTNITFKESDTLVNFGHDRYLDARIELNQRKLQSLQAEIAGTNSSGDLGVRGNLTYSNFNLFRGAEVFNMRLTGAIESLKNQTNNNYNSMKEIGVDANIVFPKFFIPFAMEDFVKKYAPKTTLSGSFNYQSRPDYTRSIANGSFSYKWNTGKYITHSFWPLELNYINIYTDLSDKKFLDSIAKTRLAYSFEDHVINDLRYSFELNNQTIGKSRNFVFARLNIESAAFLMNNFNRWFNQPETNGSHTLLNVPYFQYLLGDIDFRYYNVIDKQNRIVYRLFIGLGYPYGNSSSLPYEKKYFSGGPNSLRAWNTRDIGPGSFVEPKDSLFFFPNKNGDIKLEANIEYRFKLIWKIEAAMFADVGNIWNMRYDSTKINAEFNFNRFHKEIAVAGGVGLRFDFSFFLLRIDVGIRFRDPSFPDGKRWIPVFNNFGFDDLHWKFGIGYPF